MLPNGKTLRMTAISLYQKIMARMAWASVKIAKFLYTTMNLQKVRQMILATAHRLRLWCFASHSRVYSNWSPLRGVLDLTFLSSSLGRVDSTHTSDTSSFSQSKIMSSYSLTLHWCRLILVSISSSLLAVPRLVLMQKIVLKHSRMQNMALQIAPQHEFLTPLMRWRCTRCLWRRNQASYLLEVTTFSVFVSGIAQYFLASMPERAHPTNK